MHKKPHVMHNKSSKLIMKNCAQELIFIQKIIILLTGVLQFSCSVLLL